jgi:hypothetical protein
MIRACCRGKRSMASAAGKAGQVAGGLLSLAVWVFMPKCPLCVAAYVALWTGVGLSLAAATFLREGLLFGSGAVLLYLVVANVKWRWSGRWRANSGGTP